MLLIEEDKEELRKSIEQELERVPDGVKVHLDKSLLESLLFLKVCTNKEKGYYAKLPIWSGPFLKKLDLSKVDFEDVSWAIVNNMDPYFRAKDYCDNLKDLFNTFSQQFNVSSLGYLPKNDSKYVVDYSYTNARINFKKSYEYKRLGEAIIKDCSFDGIYLREQIKDIGIILRSSLRNSFINSFRDGVRISYSDLTGNNLTNCSIHYSDNIVTNNFMDTNVSIDTSSLSNDDIIKYKNKVFEKTISMIREKQVK